MPSTGDWPLHRSIKLCRSAACMTTINVSDIRSLGSLEPYIGISKPSLLTWSERWRDVAHDPPAPGVAMRLPELAA